MKRSKFSDRQIMDPVSRGEAGIGVPDICRELGVSTVTFYKWWAKYGGMDVPMMSRMKDLDEENRRLKKIYLEEKHKGFQLNHKRVCRIKKELELNLRIKLRKRLVRENQRP